MSRSDQTRLGSPTAETPILVAKHLDLLGQQYYAVAVAPFIKTCLYSLFSLILFASLVFTIFAIGITGSSRVILWLIVLALLLEAPAKAAGVVLVTTAFAVIFSILIALVSAALESVFNADKRVASITIAGASVLIASLALL